MWADRTTPGTPIHHVWVISSGPKMLQNSVPENISVLSGLCAEPVCANKKHNTRPIWPRLQPPVSSRLDVSKARGTPPNGGLEELHSGTRSRLPYRGRCAPALANTGAAKRDIVEQRVASAFVRA